MSNIVIEGLEYVEGPIVRTSCEIEIEIKNSMDKFGIPENFIETFSGVRERREWPTEISVPDVAFLSTKKLLDRLDIDLNEIGIIINTSLSRDFTEPTSAVMVHDKLGLNDRCINFDINNACLGFSNAVDVVSSILQTRNIKYGLIFCAESTRRFTNCAIERLKDPNISLEDFMLEFATLTLGSGSVAMLLCKEEDSKHSKHIIKEQLFSVDSKYALLCKADHYRMVCSTDMLKAGISIVEKTRDLCAIEFSNWSVNELDRVFPHQISMPHIKALCKLSGLDINKLELNFPYLGNLAPAAWPASLFISEKEGRLVEGMNIGILSIGTGFNCSALRIIW